MLHSSAMLGIYRVSISPCITCIGVSREGSHESGAEGSLSATGAAGVPIHSSGRRLAPVGAQLLRGVTWLGLELGLGLG